MFIENISNSIMLNSTCQIFFETFFGLFMTELDKHFSKFDKFKQVSYILSHKKRNTYQKCV